MVESNHTTPFVPDSKLHGIVAGICMRRKDAYDRDALHFAPFVLFPSPFPRSAYPKIFSLPTFQTALKSSNLGCKSTTHPPLHLCLTRPPLFHFRTFFLFPLISLALHQPAFKAETYKPQIITLTTIYSCIPAPFPPCIKIPRRLAHKSEEI